ncbi:hypothetical protein GGR56DRAFT_624378 [Xylariaceae sp. FL0804]|nr:hypothetical protein GGR56DRAFT_624378 [Xylariaceae sp. FL0804]
MPVTELAWLPLKSPGKISAQVVEHARAALDAQSTWCAENAPSLPTGSPAARGAAIFQEREEPKTLLVTAHWESAEQHLQWIGSEANQAVMERCKGSPY